MRGHRQGVVLPAILAVLLALGLLSSLAVFDAAQEWRVAAFADDMVRAHAAAVEGLGDVGSPPDLAALCLRSPLAGEERERESSGGGRIRVLWRHLGNGLVRAEVEGWGRAGGRWRYLALVVPDSTERVPGLFGCPDARGLVPVGRAWVQIPPVG